MSKIVKVVEMLVDGEPCASQAHYSTGAVRSFGANAVPDTVHSFCHDDRFVKTETVVTAKRVYQFREWAL